MSCFIPTKSFSPLPSTFAPPPVAAPGCPCTHPSIQPLNHALHTTHFTGPLNTAMPRRKRKRPRSRSVGSANGGTPAGKRGGHSRRSSKGQEVKRQEEEEEEEEETASVTASSARGLDEEEEDEVEGEEDEESRKSKDEDNDDEEREEEEEEEEEAAPAAPEAAAAAAPAPPPLPILRSTPSYKRLRSWRDPEKKQQGGVYLGMEVRTG